MKKLIGVAVAIVLMAAVCAGCGQNQGGKSGKGGVTVLKLGHSLDTDHPVHKALTKMSELLGEKSGGSMRIDVYPNEQLGSEREMIELVQLGSIDMVKTSTAPLEGFVPIMGVFSVPYIFRDADHYWKVLNGPIGKRLLEAGVGVGLHGVCYYDSGSRSFYTKNKPILKPEDLKGLKIRVMQSKTSMAMIEALGGSPTPIAWGELYTSLQQGVVDGAENNPPSFYSSRHYEVCKYYSLDEHTRTPDIVVISEVVWKKLTPQQRQWIQDSADESAVFERKLWKTKTQESLDAVEKAGVKIYHPDKTLFAAKVEPMHKSYENAKDPKLAAIGKLIDEIKQVH